MLQQFLKMLQAEKRCYRNEKATFQWLDHYYLFSYVTFHDAKFANASSVLVYLLSPLLSLAIWFISSWLNVNSKILILSLIWSTFLLPGMTINPIWTCHFNMTWAVLFWYLLAMLVTIGLFNNYYFVKHHLLHIIYCLFSIFIYLIFSNCLTSLDLFFIVW